MQKIPTIFDRDWEGNRGVINDLLINPRIVATAHEKLDGTNVRVTIRNGQLKLLEKRRTPSKQQKKEGITQPCYAATDVYDPADQYIWEAARNRDYTTIPDGSWEAEVLGPKIQGNPLNLEQHTLCIFSYGEAPHIVECPLLSSETLYDDLKAWLPKRRSEFGEGLIEGIVWWSKGRPVGKIKTKDFKQR